MPLGIAQTALFDETNIARITRVCAMLAFAVTMISLIAIAAGASPADSWFGFGLSPIPSALVGLACLALSLIAATHERHTIATLLLVAPASVLVVFPLQHLLGAPGHHLLHAQADESLAITATPTADLLLLSLATVFAQRPGRGAGAFAIIFASLALAVALISLLTLTSDLIDQNAISKILLMSPAAALCSVLLSTGILALRRESGWPALLDQPGATAPIVRVAFPAVLAVPIATMIFELVAERYDLLPASLASVFAACANVVTLAVVFLWCAQRINLGQVALVQTKDALDSAAVTITDLSGCILHWSDGCERLYGWPRATAVGRTVYELLSSTEDGQRAASPTFETGPPLVARTLCERTRSGECITVIEEVRLTSQPDREPRLVRSITDITELHKATDALRESEMRLELALDAHTIGICQWDRATDEVQWSPGSEERLGLIPGQISNFEDWSKLIEPDDRSRIDATIKRAIHEKAQEFSFTYRYHTIEGELRTVEGSARCLYDRDGEFAGTVGVNIDVTDRVHADLALRARDEQFRSVLETVPSSMLIIDESGKLLSLSKSAEALFGYPAEEIIGQSIMQLTAEDAAPGGLPDSLKAHLARPGADMHTMTARNREGKAIPVEVWVNEFETHASRLFTIFMQDISERLNAEERLYELRDDLAHVSRVNTMGEITAGIAHELNQPLAATVNFLGAAEIMLKSDTPDAEQASDTVRRASEQAIRAGDIIRRLRQFMSRGEVEMRPLQLDEVIEDAAALMQIGRGQYEIALEIDLPADLPRAMADRVQIQQVLINLLRNAIEELRQQPSKKRRIRIAARQVDEEMIELCVEDSGSGLPDNFLQQLYSPFVSAKKTGMGIGLSICRRIVEAHGGKLSADNKPTGGAVFRFTLPVMRAEELA